jgi:hypothetical protein
MSYKGRKTTLEDGQVQVELMNGSTVERTRTAFDDSEANAIIIVWIAQEGYTRLDVTDQDFTPDMDNFDSLYLYSE